MITYTITEQQALAGFGCGVDCSQAVFSEIAPQLGLDRDSAMKIAACFGGGMWHGETCGCVVGALMAIGLKYGQGESADPEKKQAMLAKKARFEQAFSAGRGSCLCREILGYDLSKPEEAAKVMEENLFEKICCKAVVEACEILKDVLNDESTD
ncbi:MAG: C-GCAxxG-C-C family protein [Hominenteromicrobium sp.]